ncbi:MAG: AraC family transcriptional regulator [Cytophagales bacterium]|nr:AraC family transcriptional regulator [Cytophagales bacterium]
MQEDLQIPSLWDFDAQFRHKLKRTGGYYLLFLKKASGTLTLDFVEHKVIENMLFFIAKDRAIQTRLLNDPGGWVIYFDDPFLDVHDEAHQGAFDNLQFHYFCHQPFVTLTPASLTHIKFLWEGIQAEFSRAVKNKEAIRSYLKLLLIHYQRIIKSEAEEKGTSGRYIPVIQVRKDIERHFKTQKNAAFYAGRQNFSTKHLNEIVKGALGKTITNLIHERILLEAKRMLLFSDKSIKEIAYDLGYEDPPYFFRFFKNSEGITPERFRGLSENNTVIPADRTA